MPSEPELRGRLNTGTKPAHDLVAYRPALGQRLAELRRASGLSQNEAARLAGIRVETLKCYEDAERRLTMPRLIRLMALYDADPLDVLAQTAAVVRSQPEPLYEPLVDALLYFCGVTPEQVLGRAHQMQESTQDAAPVSAPLGEVLKGRRDDHPARVQGSLLLRREYEAGASIRALSHRHRLAFGTIRALLMEANTQLRGPGRAQRGTA